MNVLFFFLPREQRQQQYDQITDNIKNSQEKFSKSSCAFRISQALFYITHQSLLTWLTYSQAYFTDGK